MQNPRNLLRCKKIKGEAAGLAILADMAAQHVNTLKALENRDLAAAKSSVGLLSINEKDRIIARIASPDELRIYDNYALLHGYIIKVTGLMAGAISHAETGYYRLLGFVTLAVQTEAIQAKLRSYYPPTDDPLSPLNHNEVASLEEKYAEIIAAIYTEYKDALRRVYAYENIILLIGERVGVPELSIFCVKNDLQARTLSLEALASQPDWQGSPGTGEIMARLFPPLDFASLKPTEATLRVCRKKLEDLSHFKTEYDPLFDLIMGGFA